MSSREEIVAIVEIQRGLDRVKTAWAGVQAAEVELEQAKLNLRRLNDLYRLPAEETAAPRTATEQILVERVERREERFLCSVGLGLGMGGRI